ncbi:MAG: cellulose binding domain-containing protein, partial [Chloroflexota bacterium]
MKSNLSLIMLIAFASYLTVACTTEVDSTDDTTDSVTIVTSTEANGTPPSSSESDADFNPTATNTLLPSNTASPLTVTIAKTDQENELEEQFDLRIRNESNRDVSNISLRIYYTPDADHVGTDYVLATYWDEIEATTITGPEQVNETLSY